MSGRRVYFLRRADGIGPIKIGCSVYPEARRKQLGIDFKAQMTLLAEVPGDFRVEGRLHRQFANLRVEGEWFEPAPRLLAAVDRAKRTGRAPPASEEDREIVFARRYLAGETLEQIAADHDITRERVRQILRASGIPSLGRRDCHKRHSLAEKQAGRVIALANEGRTVPEIAEAIGDRAHNVRTCLERHEVQPVKGKRVPTQKTIATAHEIARRYATGEKTASIAQAFGVAQPNIYHFLRVVGVEPCRGQGPQRRPDTQAILTAYRRGDTMREIAARHGCSPGSVKALIHRNGAGLSREEAELRRVAAVRRANVRRAEARQIAA